MLLLFVGLTQLARTAVSVPFPRGGGGEVFPAWGGDRAAGERGHQKGSGRSGPSDLVKIRHAGIETGS